MPQRFDDSNTHAALRRVGTSLRGRYRIRHLIGIGGMSAVYAGLHRNGHAVAIKVLHERLSTAPDLEQLFRREALLVNTIRHPGVVPVIDDDIAEDGSTFLVMPLLSGETLRTRAARNGLKLPLEDVLFVANALLDILRTAHEARIVHCDIKPDNIFGTDNGEIRVLDFGIARFFTSSVSATITHSIRAMGTPAFMAPEQALGRTREIDAQTDIWGVGATIFTLLTGRFVHQAGSANETLVLAATQSPTSLADVEPDIPKCISEVVDRALASDKTRRWPNADSMNDAVIAACESVLGVHPSKLGRPSASVLESSDSRYEGTTLRPIPQNLLVAATMSHAPRRPARPWVRFIVTAFLGIAFVAAAIFVHARGSFLTTNAGPTGKGHAQPTPALATTGETQVLLEAALELWKNASTEAARKKFAEAAESSHAFPAAHLYFVGASDNIEPDARSHFSEAQSLRGRLSPVQAALLSAMEPAMTEPPQHDIAASRLEAVTKQYPDDPIAWLIRGGHGMRTRESARLLAIVDRIPGAIGHWFRARAELSKGDVVAARRALWSCIEAAPHGGVDCLRTLARLEANEGQCEQSARAALKLIDVDPMSPDGYMSLARAEFGRSHRTSSVRPILEDKWARLPEVSREDHRWRDEFFLNLLDGDFDHAYASLDRWESAVANSSDGQRRGRPLIYRVELELELGRTDLAQRAARRFMDSSPTWLRYEFVDNSVEITRLLYRTALIDRDEFLRRRAKDEEALAARGGILGHPGVRWYAAYAETVVTPEDARLAVAHLPPGPVLDAEMNEVNMDMEMGRTFLYAGELERAMQALGRAAKSCLYWKSLQNIPAHALYGDALAQSNRPREACAEYAYVLERWGREPRSRTARDAHEAAIRLGCADLVRASPHE